MAITRRQFLKSGSTAAAGALFAPRLFGSRVVEDALAEIGDRYFVIVYLEGGNDGLNTVVPTGGMLRQWYENARTGAGGLRLTAADLANSAIGNDPNTGAPLAFHPALRAAPNAGGPGDGGLHALYTQGHVAVIQGCGYPNHNLSHETSRHIFQTGDPFQSLYAGTGWVGRHLASAYAGEPTFIPAVTIGDRVAFDFQQRTTNVLTIKRLRDYDFPYRYLTSDAERAAHDVAFNALHAEAQNGVDDGFRHIGTAGATTLTSANSYRELDGFYNDDPTRRAFGTLYDGVSRGMSRDLREVAKVIWGTEHEIVNTRFFAVETGGYDTHTDQGGGAPTGQHYNLHAELGASLKVFYDDLASMGVADRVTVMVYSEFSRRIRQNQSGTDHGSQGPMFLIGGGVAGGVYGNHPRIDPTKLDSQGNTNYRQNGSYEGFESTDFRDVYGTILKHWMGVDPLGFLTPDSGDPTYHWTIPNFDLSVFVP